MITAISGLANCTQLDVTLYCWEGNKGPKGNECSLGPKLWLEKEEDGERSVCGSYEGHQFYVVPVLFCFPVLQSHLGNLRNYG